MGKKSSSKTTDSPSKTKEQKTAKMAVDEDSTEVPFNPRNLVEIAHPLAEKKLLKKVIKTVKKAAKQKHVKRGVKEVVKALRKGEKGLVILAGDISPMDVVSHLPVLCEDQSVPYVWVPSKRELGSAGSTKRPTSVVLIPEAKKKAADYEETYDSVLKEVKGLPVLPSAMA